MTTDILWPTDNEWGIPVLDSTMQAEMVELPVAKWGTARRSSIMTGTYHFYTDDYKFTGLWTTPSTLINSRCTNIIEPNFSTHIQMPRALALHRIYQKRWLARYAQHHGIRVFVDLCVEGSFSDLNLFGVPLGWRAYANRGYSDERFDNLQSDFELACNHRGADDILYVVYGGGKRVQQACLAQHWVWIPEQSDSVRGRYTQESVTAKLTRAKVEEIRQRLQTDENVKQVNLAEEYGVSPATISDIMRGKTWQRLEKE